MNQSEQLGFWSVIVGTVLFSAAVVTGPSGGCIPAVGRDHTAHIGVRSVSSVQYTLAGNTCYLNITYLLGFIGFFLVVFGGLLWSGSRLAGEPRIDTNENNNPR